MTILGLAATCCLAAPPLFTPQEQEPDRTAATIADAKKRLAAIGFDVPDGVKIADRDAKETLASLDAQQDVLFPPNGFAVQFELRRAFGLGGPQGAAAMRTQAVAGMARGLAAYYDPLEKAFVLLPAAADGAQRILVVHELVHACQDARDGGITKFFDARNATLDTALVRRCVMEGEAELAVVVALQGDARVQALLGGGGDGIEKVLSGELTALLYQHGRKLAARGFLASGWPAVRELWQKPPPTCEQVMHEQKLGHDVPQIVTVPAIPGTEVAHRTTLGELMIYFMLRERRLSARDAALAAAGWDGDDLVVLRAKDGGATGLVWRTVWDRDEDARQFAAALPTTKHTAIATSGSSVDFVFSVAPAPRDQLVAACAEAKAKPVADDEDAASTAAVEAELRARDDASAVRDEKWELPALGLTIPVPPKWELREVQGVKMLFDTATIGNGFGVNVNVQAMPRGAAADLAAIVTESRTGLQRAGVTVVKLEPGKSGATDVIHGEFHGRIGRLPPVHCVQLIYLRGDQQVIVTATSSPEQWAEYEKPLRAILDGVVITPP